MAFEVNYMLNLVTIECMYIGVFGVGAVNRFLLADLEMKFRIFETNLTGTKPLKPLASSISMSIYIHLHSQLPQHFLQS